MNFKQLPKVLIALTLAMSLLISACGGKASTPPSGNQSTNNSGQTTVAQKPVSGSQFNKFFPKSQDGYQVVFAQEKTGFAEAKLNQGGKNVAMLSINDLANNPSAATKYQQSSKTISGYPAVTQGKNTTAILVANRHQVKVQSRAESFTANDREEWLGKFNLNGLSRIK
ncbi:hypothetical protein [Planktothrix agardhii]|jgi:hypothetical protein|uniref:Uncharacterized protein n=1 Tax=Planktothrix agardhii TaxID=1160 RepID=A0A1J1JCE2_PLAAG|nr:hypothetical protein [Planktothrix agardhii]MBG0745021.1 hypothetical protein [Planktothrix agardhii KL2]MCF3583153.1 hypothetical protein [Planktothrix agardhii 1811]MCF3625788.1 hypothetical protein [Planktothrix agardhii 1801]MDS1345571.1 hypothetical protein [Planktothrix agardhii NRERC-751]CAD5947497.1 hypothetical protein NO976_02392 [Planktothrix agardhii]